MDPKSRPTFDELVLRLEHIRQTEHIGAGEGSQVLKNVSNSAEKHLSSQQLSPPPPPPLLLPPLPPPPVTLLDVASSATSTTSSTSSSCRPQEKKMSSSKFDHDVYLVAGNSPSEKARCHYLHGHPKDKTVK